MTLEDKPRFVSALKRLFGAWNQTPSEDQLGAWWLALRDYPVDRVTDALRATLQEADGDYPPPPARVRKRLDLRHRAFDELPDAARHAPGCTGCSWVTLDQRHPEAGTGRYKPDALRSRAVRGCRVDLHGVEAA